MPDREIHVRSKALADAVQFASLLSGESEQAKTCAGPGLIERCRWYYEAKRSKGIILLTACRSVPLCFLDSGSHKRR